MLSSDSDIRFTRKNLGENEKCGCALIAGFLAALLLAGAIIYIGCEYIRWMNKPLLRKHILRPFLIKAG